MASLNNITPLVNNTDLIDIVQIVKSSEEHLNNLSDDQYEKFILYNLAKNQSFYDISINEQSIPVELSFNDTNIIIIDQSELSFNKRNVIINNNENLIQSEKFAIDIKYGTLGTSSYEQNQYVILGPQSNIPSNISLTDKTRSYYDSNLKFDVSLNNDNQYTDKDNWSVQFDRKYNNMNYFAAINSHLNTVDNVYPFQVIEDVSINEISLGTDGYYFTVGENDRERKLHTFDENDLSQNTLSNNGLQLIPINNYVYDGSEFKTYKIEQKLDSLIDVSIKNNDNNNSILGNDLPLSTDSGEDISFILFNFDNLSESVNSLDENNSKNIENNFTGTLTIGANEKGGYSCDNIDQELTTTNVSFLDDNQLTNDNKNENHLNYFIDNRCKGKHSIDVSNGRVYVDSNNSNSSFISLSSDYENLDPIFADQSGVIFIQNSRVDTSNNTDGRVNFFKGSRSNLTEKVSVYYNTTETDGGLSFIDNSLCIAKDVSYNLNVLIESTNNRNTLTYDSTDPKNLAQNTPVLDDELQNVRLVIANNLNNDNIQGETSFKIFEEDPDNKIRNEDSLSIFNIKNSVILVADGELYDSLDNNGNAINHIYDSTCNVSLTDTAIFNNISKYIDYRIILETKTAQDLQDSLTPSNLWELETTTLENDRFNLQSDYSGYLIGNPSRVSEIIYNDAKFISGTTPVTIKYTFVVEPTAKSLNSIKYNFNPTLNDPTNDNTNISYRFGGNTDIIIDILNTSDILLKTLLPDEVSGNNIDGYIFERWLRRKEYKAKINPSLPFYENLLIKTETIYEEAIYYKVYNKLGNEVKFTELDSYKYNDIPLSIVNVRLVERFENNNNDTDTDTKSLTRSNPYTNISLHPSDCCIFYASLQGKTINGWEYINDLKNRAHIDPFIVNDGTISNSAVDGINFTCHVAIKLETDIVIKKPTYYTSSPIDVNVLTAELYKFDIPSIEDKLTTNFSPYNNTFSDLHTAKSPIKYFCDLSLNDDEYTLTISHSNNNSTYKDVEIIYPKKYILNFNIIYSPFNLISIERDIDSVNSKYYSYDTNDIDNSIVTVNNGVYLTLQNGVTYGMTESFNLKPDSVNVQFINNLVVDNRILYQNNNTDWSNYMSQGGIQYKPINSYPLTITPKSAINKTKSITLNRVRGYDINNGNAIITINRIPATYKFILDVSGETYTQSYNSGVDSFNITNLEYQGKIIDIGLILNIQKSILEDSYLRKSYPVTVKAADYKIVFKNNDPLPNIHILNGEKTGNLFDINFNNFFKLKTRSLKTKSKIIIELKYTSSSITVYSSDTYNTKPSLINDWEYIIKFSLDETEINRTFYPNNDNNKDNSCIGFQKIRALDGNFISYLVFAPLSIKVKFNGLTNKISQLPFSQTQIEVLNKSTTLFFDIKTKNPSYNLHDFTNDSIVGNNIIIKNDNLDFDKYKNHYNSTAKNFIINGNYIKIQLFSGLNRPTQEKTIIYIDSSLNIVPPGSSDISYSYDVFSDSLNNLITTVYTGAINNILINQPLTYNVSMNGIKYDISYNQDLSQFTNVTNDTFNINFIIDNAFIPPNTSYIPLKSKVSTTVTFYEANNHYNNGKYYLFLNRYSLNSGTDYNRILSTNTNIRELSFMVNLIEQKAVELYISDSPCAYEPVDINLLDNFTVNDLSGDWQEISNALTNIGITFSTNNMCGVENISNLFKYNTYNKIDNKTLFINRADILRVISGYGMNVFRITNSGNIITPKITTAIVSLFQQNITIESRNIPYDSNPAPTGLFYEGTIDYKGDSMLPRNIVR